MSPEQLEVYTKNILALEKQKKKKPKKSRISENMEMTNKEPTEQKEIPPDSDEVKIRSKKS